MNFWEIIAKVVAPIISALGIIVVSALAIWGEYVKARPKLKLYTKNLAGERTEFVNKQTGQRIPVYIYHLNVKNEGKVLAKNVKVLCREIYRRRHTERDYTREDINIAQQFMWAPAELSQITPNILKDHPLDLGVLETGKFSLRFYVTPNNFSGYITPGMSMKIALEVLADNFRDDRKLYYYEIIFTDTDRRTLEDSKDNLTIKELDSL